MSVGSLISPAEYLATSWRPDRELVDGQLIERNVGEFDHSNLQAAITAWLRYRQREWNIRVLVEQRIRVAPGRFRIADVCVISREQPIEPVFTKPPLVCIEILSKDDTLRGMRDRVHDYIAFGVPNIWIFDPVSRDAWVCGESDFRKPEGNVLRASASPIAIPLADLFADLD